MKPFYFSLGALGSMSLDNALDIIKEAKFKEHLLGDISTSKLQLCPQQYGYIDETVICKLLTEFSNIEFRFHANVNILGRREIVDICDFKNRRSINQEQGLTLAIRLTGNLTGNAVFFNHTTLIRELAFSSLIF